jgi:hypothetical protein
VFSGSGDSTNKYENARISEDGWCSSGTGYLLLDLKKEYHITKVVLMADKEQTKWASSYILKYSNDITYRKSTQVYIYIYIENTFYVYIYNITISYA